MTPLARLLSSLGELPLRASSNQTQRPFLGQDDLEAYGVARARAAVPDAVADELGHEQLDQWQQLGADRATQDTDVATRLVVVMHAGGFTAAEQTMISSGEPDRVVEMREDFQRVMAEDYKETIEQLTERKVLAFLSNAHVDPELTVEIFFVDRPLDGFGAVEVTAPQ